MGNQGKHPPAAHARFCHLLIRKQRRLIYCSLNCLRHCLEAIRLCTSGTLTPTAHTLCSSADCTAPGLDGLSKRIPKYVEALTGALLRKKRDEDDNWVLVFYSLCIQSYVRRGLMKLDDQWRASSKSPDCAAQPLGSHNYLQGAVSLFCRVSAQNRGKLANQIERLPATPSAYVGVSSLGDLLDQPLPHVPTTAGSWDKWREQGIDRHLRRIFEIEDGVSVPNTKDAPNDDYNSDGTVTAEMVTQIGNRRNRVSNGSLQHLNPSKRAQIATIPKRVPSPALSSRYSMTSRGESDSTSITGTWDSSALSLPVSATSSRMSSSYGGCT